MLTVWSVCVGDKYIDEDVHILRAMVARNLGEHRFRCLTDRNIPGIDCEITAAGWPGWWTKLELFKVATGQNLYLDLDVVIAGPLEPLVSRQLSMPANWAQSGHGGCQSSVMSWGDDYGFIADAFDPDQLSEPENGNFGYYGPDRLWGDQEYITAMLGSPGEGRVIPMQGVYSYKYHCRQGLPNDAAVACFHGLPKPDQVSDAWVRAARSSTATAA